MQGGFYSILFLLFEGSRDRPRGLVAFFFSLVVAVVKVLAVGQVRVLGSDLPFLSANHNKNHNEKSP